MALHFHPQPKPMPPALERKDRRTARKSADEKENAKVRKRSEGRCEVTCLGVTGRVLYRCERLASQIHHRLSGIGVRGRGDSTLAQWKLHLCARHHSEIHAHILVPDGDHFRRVK
mgnify:FL=1